jgi:twitching motility protein PilT
LPSFIALQQTIDRIIDAFPAGQQAQIRTMLSESLKGVLCQQLLRRTDKPGRLAALEILFCKTAIANLIREGKTFQIPSVMQTSKGEGMQLLDVHLMQLVKDGVIAPEDAYLNAASKEAFHALIEKPKLAA